MNRYLYWGEVPLGLPRTVFSATSEAVKSVNSAYEERGLDWVSDIDTTGGEVQEDLAQVQQIEHAYKAISKARRIPVNHKPIHSARHRG